MENKRKRIKLECLKCGGVFNKDYRAKHERQQHNGKRVSVKHFGAPENPFEASKYLHKAYSPTKTSTSSTMENIQNIEENNVDTCTSVEKDPIQLEVTKNTTTCTTYLQPTSEEENCFSETIEYLLDALEDDCAVLSSKKNENDLDTKEINNHSENTESWIDCVGKLSSLVQIIKECKMLLKKVHDDDIPNPIHFLTMSIELISSVKEKSTMYIQSASNVLSKEFTSNKLFSTNEKVVDKLLDHDPGKRGKVESASQRNYLLSLGPYPAS